MPPAFDAELRRVSVHVDAAVLDVSLPAEVPVATLIPSIIDILGTRPTVDDVAAVHYQLSRPGLPALPASTSLAQNDIADGTVLVLSRSSPNRPPCATTTPRRPYRPSSTRRVGRATPRDSPGAVAAGGLTVIGLAALVRNTLNANDTGATAGAAGVAGVTALMFAAIAHRTYRDSTTALTLGLIATAFASATGFFAVSGTPGAPHVLLAATAAATMSVLALRVTSCGRMTLVAVACFATVVAVAALGE